MTLSPISAEELNNINGAPATNGDGTTPLTKGNLEINAKALSEEPPEASAVSDMEVESEKPSSDIGSEYDAGSPAHTPPHSSRNGINKSDNPGPKMIAHAKERALAREKAAELKAAQATHKRKDDDLAKLDRKLETIERDFRQIMGLGRTRPLGRDRFYNRIWWFDGLGSASLIGHSGNVVYGSGRVFIQGPSEVDLEVMMGRLDVNDVVSRRAIEEGESGTLRSGEWACYSEPEQVRHRGSRNGVPSLTTPDSLKLY